MRTAITPRSQTAIRLVTAAGMLLVVVGLAVLCQQARNSADFIASLRSPGGTAPDTSSMQGLVVASGALAVAAAAIAAVSLLRGGRAIYAATAVCAAFGAVMTVFAVATMPLLNLQSSGPVVLTPMLAAVFVVVGAVVAVGAALIGWKASPSDTIPRAIYMPPPTHQA